MNYIFIFLPLLVILIPMFIMKIDKKMIINGLFYGLIAVLLGSVAYIPFGVFTNILGIFGLGFIGTFLAPGVCEEIFKFLPIKFISKKDKSNYIIYGILIGISVELFESTWYMIGYGSSIGLDRMLYPGHLFYQLIMLFFIYKTFDCQNKFKKIIYYILGLVIPILLHSMWDVNVFINLVPHVILYLIGIFTYVLAIILIIKTKINNSEVKFFKFKFIIVIIAVLFSIFGCFTVSKDNINSINSTVDISEDKIEITVLEPMKKVTELDWKGESVTYQEVTIKFKNNRSSAYSPSILRFSLVDKNGESITADEVENKSGNLSIESGFTDTLVVKFKTTKDDFSYFNYELITLNNNYKFAISK